MNVYTNKIQRKLLIIYEVFSKHAKNTTILWHIISTKTIIINNFDWLIIPPYHNMLDKLLNDQLTLPDSNAA